MYDTKADVWSLGITVYEMATGTPPHTHLEALRAIQLIPRAEPPVLDGAQWSPAMHEFLAASLVKDANHRPLAEELGKHKWIRSASKMPTSLLRELIMRYGGWVNAGGVRMSIIGDVARRDDTFDFDTAGSWLFDDQDEPVESLGDEPNYKSRRSRNDQPKVPAAAPRSLADLFDSEDTSSSSLSQGGIPRSSIHIPSDTGSTSNWGAGTDTLRPGSINLPSMNDDAGMSGFVPSSTPWFAASAFSVGKIEREAELIDADGAPVSGQIDLDSRFGSGDDSHFADASGPSTMRAPFSSAFGAISGASGFPNAFPRRRARQQSEDSLFGSGSDAVPFGRVAVNDTGSWSISSAGGLTFASSNGPFSPSDEDTASNYTDSPTSITPGRKGNDKRRDMTMFDDDDSGFATSKPLNNGMKAIASRLRANTRTNMELSSTAAASSPATEAPFGKSVLAFGASPFGPQKQVQRKPSALNIAESGKIQASKLSVRHDRDFSDDNCATPMPASTPLVSAFPFPSTSTSALSASSASSSTYSASLAEWPSGPHVQPLDYALLSSPQAVNAQLQAMIANLGQWLNVVETGMEQILAECA